MKRDPEAFEAKRAELRSAFAQIVAAGRFEDATWVATCNKAGFSTSALIYYFGNRAEMLWSVVSHHIDRLLERLGAAAPDPMPPRSRLSAMARAYAEVTGEYGAEHRISLEHNQRLTPVRSRDAQQMQRWVLDMVAAPIRILLPADAQNRAVPLALSLLAMLNAQTRWLRDGHGVSRRDYADMAVRMVLADVSQYRRAARRGGGAEPLADHAPGHGG